MTEEALVKKLDKTANRYIAAIARGSAALERIATTFEELERRVHGTKRRKKRAPKSVKPK